MTDPILAQLKAATSVAAAGLRNSPDSLSLHPSDGMADEAKRV